MLLLKKYRKIPGQIYFNHCIDSSWAHSGNRFLGRPRCFCCNRIQSLYWLFLFHKYQIDCSLTWQTSSGWRKINLSPFFHQRLDRGINGNSARHIRIMESCIVNIGVTQGRKTRVRSQFFLIYEPVIIIFSFLCAGLPNIITSLGVADGVIQGRTAILPSSCLSL